MKLELKEDGAKKNILIFDMGGGTTDVTVIATEGYKIEVKSALGNAYLGGEDFDNKFLHHLAEKYRKGNNNDVTCNNKSMYKLRLACEKAKRELSLTQKANIEVDSLFQGIDYSTQVTREEFQQLFVEEESRIKTLVIQALKDANVSLNNIEDILLVGGSTRVPIIQAFLSQALKTKSFNKTVNVDEAIAYGTAAQAALLMDNIPGILRFRLFDILPLSLGVIFPGGTTVDIVFERNTKIQNQLARHYFITSTDLNNCFLTVIQIENFDPLHYYLLGNFRLSEITQLKEIESHIHQTELTFGNNIHGIVEVKMLKGLEEIIVRSVEYMYPDNRILEMMMNAKTFRDEENNERNRVAAKDKLESYCLRIKKKIEEMINKNYSSISGSLHDVLKDINELRIWLETNKFASQDLYEEREINFKKKFECIQIMYQKEEKEQLRIEAMNSFKELCSHAKVQVQNMSQNPNVKLSKNLSYIDSRINDLLHILGDSSEREMYEEQGKSLRDDLEIVMLQYREEEDEQRLLLTSRLNACCTEIQEDINEMIIAKYKIPLGSQNALLQKIYYIKSELQVDDKCRPKEWYEKRERYLREEIKKMQKSCREYEENYILTLSTDQAKENVVSFCSELHKFILNNKNLSDSQMRLLKEIDQTLSLLEKMNYEKKSYVETEQKLRNKFDELDKQSGVLSFFRGRKRSS